MYLASTLPLIYLCLYIQIHLRIFTGYPCWSPTFCALRVTGIWGGVCSCNWATCSRFSFCCLCQPPRHPDCKIPVKATWSDLNQRESLDPHAGSFSILWGELGMCQNVIYFPCTCGSKTWHSQIKSCMYTDLKLKEKLGDKQRRMVAWRRMHNLD